MMRNSQRLFDFICCIFWAGTDNINFSKCLFNIKFYWHREIHDLKQSYRLMAKYVYRKNLPSLPATLLTSFKKL